MGEVKKRIRFFCGDSRLPYVNFFIYYRGFPRLLPDMRAETEALKKILDNPPLAQIYAREAFLHMGEQLDEMMGDFLQKQLLKYSKITVLKDKIHRAKDISEKLQVVIDQVPGLLFMLPFRFNAGGRPGMSLKLLRIAVVAYGLEKYREPQTFLSGYNASIPFNMTIAQINEAMGSEEGDPSFLPRTLATDFTQVAQGFLKIPQAEKIKDAVELYYLAQGTAQVFNNLFFELICRTPTQTSLALCEKVFGYLLAALRRFELDQFVKGKFTVEQIEALIEKDAPNFRHSHLRKPIFSNVTNFSPILQNTKQKGMSANGQRLMQSQMEKVRKLSSDRASLLFKSLRRYRGPQSVVLVMGLLQRLDPSKLTEVADFLSSKDTPEEKELYQLVERFAEKIRKNTSKPVIKAVFTNKSYETERLEQAQAKLAALDSAKMMNQFKVNDYLKDRLAKLYERVKMEGALTQGGIAKHLEKFAYAADGLIGKPTVTQAEIDQFEEDAIQIVEEIAAAGDLSIEEVKQQTDAIKELAEGMKGSSADEREDLISKVGIKLMDVESIAQEKLPEEERRKIDFAKLMAAEIIPIGIQPSAPKMNVADFLSFPLAKNKEKAQANWFEYHQKYLRILIDNKRIAESKVLDIEAVLPKIPAGNFKKYFDIFPNEQLEESVLGAVYSLWENNGLLKLRISATGPEGAQPVEEPGEETQATKTDAV
ncbi:MAG: hypothetical protein A2527_00825 [Candidatus Lambdaproteobacteria bacterium RIFOXYD2_FULL_50_16]|uniref:Uncharacterized protein n=1 Tax=Candidatus Lambdaproteobacteria bacterium RIFOXYD2_FULL_50_16 TaxID=1817772 RepID=A0A1F6GFB8_9PROT|nr:MAG: hypothetical protein A2527_00825 [Candidatus Lambdaproteobacteria bacterium RIFOXYD2_FULL_50_16]